jgi:hypothetical protein
MGIIFNRAGRVEAHTRLRRLFTEGQRLAMIARDLGCSFPGCDIPPLRTEAHHITDYALTGKTTIDDGTLLCPFHHREHQKLGYRGLTINHVPYWVAPKWIDPTQTPRRNHAHDPRLE